MPFLPIPNTIELDFRMQLFGEPIEMTFYVEKAGTLIIEDLQAAAAALKDWAIEGFGTIVSDEVTFSEVYARDLSEAFGLVWTDAFTEGEGGLISQASAPGQAAFVVKRASSFAGRSKRGRVYLPGIPVTTITGNVVNSTYANDAQDQLNLLDDIFLSLDPVLQPVIVSRVSTGGLSPTGSTTPIAGWSYTSLKLGTRRGRLGAR